MAQLPESLKRPIDVLMIDNFDSFTWNLYQSLTLLGVEVTVIRNDAISSSALPYLDIKRLIISPGPGHPKTDSGISGEAVKFFTGKVPILGVCMGLEVIVDIFGGEIRYAGEIKHGKLSPIRHDGRGIFNGLPQSFQSTRYHSLSASIKTLPDVLAITAATEESGVIMAVRHRQFTIEAVQYHPESVLSEEGDSLLNNFLNLRGGTWDENPAARITDISLPPFPIAGPAIPNDVGPSSQTRPSKLPTILEKIHTQRLKDIEASRNSPGTSMEDLETLLAMNLSPPLISLVDRLRTTPETSPALMAEIKRASPSKGPISLKANAAQQALIYALAGASVVSVLTEPHWFKGSLLDMSLARNAVSSLPNRPAILRKDFIVSEYQIAEARLHGADTVLLIVALLPLPRLKALYAYSKNLGMEPLVEVNNAEEMAAALEVGARVIGVNNRNLHSFEVDMGTTSRLAEMVRGQDTILCALSGISGPEDVRRYAEQGVQAVLIGEALMRAEDTGSFIRDLLGWSLPSSSTAEEENQPPLVKICGIRTVDEALTAAQAGADLLGLNFVPSSKRRVNLEVACQIAHAIRERRTQAVTEVPLASADNQAQEEGQTNNLPWFAAHASRLTRTLRAAHARPQLVGIFQDQPLSYILSIIASVQLDIVQLHGSEPLHWASHIPVPVIRVFHVGEDGKGVEEITRPSLHQFVLLDAVRDDGLSGGSGKVVDWDLARNIADAGEVEPTSYKLSAISPSPSSLLVNGNSSNHSGAAESASPTSPSQTKPTPSSSAKSGLPRLPIILAGGLKPDNVASAVERVRPWAVDVAGGVERDRQSVDGQQQGGGLKDLEKVIAFVRAAKGLSAEVAIDSDLGHEQNEEKRLSVHSGNEQVKETETAEQES